MKHLFCFLIVFFALSANVFASSYPDSILNKPYSIQSTYLDNIAYKKAHDDTTYLNIYFKDLETWADQQADTELKLLIALCREEVWIKNAYINRAVEADLYEIIRLAGENGFNELKADGLQTLASFYHAAKKPAMALEYFINAHTVYVGFNAKNFPHKSDYAYDYGSRYYHFRDFNAAKHIFLEVWRDVPLDMIENKTSKMNTLAMCYSNLGEYDSAIYYFGKANDFAIATNNEGWSGIIKGNLASVYFNKKQYNEAIPLLEENIRLSREHKNMIDLGISLSALGDIYLIKGENKKAMEMELEAYDIVKKKKFYTNYDFTSRIYPNLAKAYYVNGNLQLAYLYLDSALIAKDTVEHERNILFISGVQHKIDNEKQKVELEKKELELTNERLARNSFIAGFIIVVILGFALYKRIVDKQKANKLLDEANNNLSALNDELLNIMDNLKSTQQQLIGSEKMAAIGSTAARMAHEIQNPLNFVNNFSELANDLIEEINGLEDGEEKVELMSLLKDNLQKINQHGKRASSIINQLQEYTRTGKLHDFFKEAVVAK